MPELIDSDLNDISITELREKINEARKWALDHFNTKEAEKPYLIDPKTLELKKPSFFVEFPEPDQMIIIPSIMGKRNIVHRYYRLIFCIDGSMEWRTNHPIFGNPLPSLKVTDEE